jgi:2-(1,2-epoxy-1,2-dihydrophenyl)acetyl-CoA isomerase
MSVYSSAIQFEVEGSVAILTLNRPESLNAMNADMGADLKRAVLEIERSSQVRILVLTGAGSVFCSGRDPEDPSSTNSDGVADYIEAWGDALASIRASRVPIIVAINGPAEGDGILLALCGDWLLAADSAEFVRLSSVIEPGPDIGLSLHFPLAVGLPAGLITEISKEPVSAAQALQWGLVNECVEESQLLARAREVATQLAQGPTQALVLTRQLVDEGIGNSFETQYRRELEVNRELRESFDGKEGVRAFLEKRPPHFRGE